MESCSLQSPAITTVPSSLSRSGFIEKLLGHGRILKLPTSKRYPLCRKFKTFDFRAQASGTTKISSEVAGTISNKADSKDEDLAFVAGATGRVGSRTVRELLKLGFRVRAGVRSAQRAQSLVQSVKQMKLDTEGTTPVEKLELVECDLEKQDTIVPAIGNASVVICSIGASEKEVFDITGPYRIDYQATKNLIDAATVAKVNHFILVSSLGTNKVGFPAAILNLFWGVLVWKRKAEEALIASGLPYTIVRPGGMERPTDAFKETHNIRLSTEDTLFGGLVSNLQVAELMACMAKNRSLSYCKVVEVVAETTAPLRPMEELLAKIPSKRADISSTKEPDAPTSAPAKSIVTEKPATPTEEPAQEKAVETRPLSPYAAYDDLKPPSSPSPTPNGPKEVSSSASAPAENVSISTEGNSATTAVAKSIVIEEPATPTEEPAQEKAVEKMPLSPYAAYDDLKPPSSPSPTPSGPKEVSSSSSTPAENVSTSTEGNSVTTAVATGISEKDSSKQPVYHSPYYAYADLKPPSSPSPRAPATAPTDNESQGAALSGNSTPQPTVADKPSEEQHDTKPKPRPLSPFAMYEDLKPPTSPIPSSPKKS
ncbi:translocon at the inner envelope membrane of chloroplasts 62 [Hibiscus trionum]|uniref:Translocon at the inner envelope membrane of chloroplasts 62 n=1 Tax=Hibiscus trionum TaxID=183268 RepID=A0A9W7JDX9_HIBTR|nr:translocon at the inner envelope membrane of chloroplasts 62 [Hibiscus trionum]